MIFRVVLGAFVGSVGALQTAGNFRTSLTLRGANSFLRFDGLRLESETKHTNESMQRVLQRETEWASCSQSELSGGLGGFRIWNLR